LLSPIFRTLKETRRLGCHVDESAFLRVAFVRARGLQFQVLVVPDQFVIEGMNGDLPVVDSQVGARQLCPAAAVEIVHVLCGFATDMVSVAATDRGAALTACIADRLFLDGLGAAQEDFAAPLGPFGELVRPIQLLHQQVGTIADPGENAMGVEEFIEAVAVQYQDLLAAAIQDVFVGNLNSKERRNDVCRAVVITANPDNLNSVRKLAKQRQYFPVRLFQAPEVDGIEDVAIENQLTCVQLPARDRSQETTKTSCLTVLAAQMDIGDNDCVAHGSEVLSGIGL